MGWELLISSDGAVFDMMNGIDNPELMELCKEYIRHAGYYVIEHSLMLWIVVGSGVVGFALGWGARKGVP